MAEGGTSTLKSVLTRIVAGGSAVVAIGALIPVDASARLPQSGNVLSDVQVEAMALANLGLEPGVSSELANSAARDMASKVRAHFLYQDAYVGWIY